MDSYSDSDSDASHISATPPRDQPPSPPPPLPPPSRSKSQSLSSLLSSAKSIIRSKSTSKPKPSCKPKPSEAVTAPSQRSYQPPNTCPFPSLQLKIRRPSDQFRPVPADHSIETLPAGYFSKLASFSKLQRPCPLPDTLKNESAAPSVSVPECDAKPCGTGAMVASSNMVQKERFGEAVSIGIPEKVARKHPNLIGGSILSLPVKRKKCVNEGNFVKLNLNRYKHKFANKGRRRNCNISGSRRNYRRNKKKMKGGVEDEVNGLCDENGLVWETPQGQGSRGMRFDCDLVEEALSAVRNEVSDENLARLMKLTHGYDMFREGQLEAIKMVLSGESAMLVLPTGAGKSLCYQLPAMILQGVTVVVSPLVALMVDQLKQLPPMIQGGLLSSSQTIEEVAETQRQLQDGKIKVLFVSPERFLNAQFLSLFSSNVRVSLVVVDEAHCLSEWSHNFRPSYMRLRALLFRDRLNAKCILAMTATATSRTLHTVMSALEIPYTNLIQRPHSRDNLQLSVSLSGNRMKDLMTLIKSSPFTEVRSIIIYCKFQFEADLVSKYLYDNNINVKSYHSGIPAKDRSRIQESFCSNKIRVVVATVAFGMGLDKRDVGAVIHYSLPESLEEYVQEIGRAGRDGRLSYCHLLFDDLTYFKLRSLMHSDGVDEYAVNRFLTQVFSNGMDLHGKICSVVKEVASRKFDMKEEVMLTLLTRLELGEVQYLRLLPQLNVTCTLNFHKTPLVLLADKDIVVAAIQKRSETKHGQYVFDIPSLANTIGVTATDLLDHLHNLKLKGEITYEMKDPAYCYTIVRVPEDFCSLASHLTKWLSEIESFQVKKLDAMFNAAVFSVKTCEKMHGCNGAQHTACMQRKILDYFSRDDSIDAPNKMAQSSPFLQADIKVFLKSNSHEKFTPRAVARIMHGIGSPAYPSATWSKIHFWGRYAQVDFQVIMEAAKTELLNFVGKDVI